MFAILFLHARLPLDLAYTEKLGTENTSTISDSVTPHYFPNTSEFIKYTPLRVVFSTLLGVYKCVQTRS